jgi:hypothetical protein
MHTVFPTRRLIFSGIALAAIGCGGGSGSMTSQVPISVSLVDSMVVVSQNGTPVNVPMIITSTSETALVFVNGLPGGVQEKYAATDTNPSGTLTFTASTAAPLGTYEPTITVKSAGQTASTSFTLVIVGTKP